MWCAECESIDEYFYSSTYFWLFLPTSEAIDKVTKMAEYAKYPLESVEQRCLRVLVEEGQTGNFLNQLNCCLDGPEFGGTKVTTSARPSQLSIEDISRMTTAEVLTRRYQAQWLTEAMDKHAYES